MKRSLSVSGLQVFLICFLVGPSFHVLGSPLSLSLDTLKTTTPLLNKVILTWLAESYAYWHLTDAEKALAGIKAPRGIGYGIGLAVALFVMQGQ